MDEKEVLNLLVGDIFDEDIDLLVESDKIWGKDLTYMPPLTIKEIEIHQQNNGKVPGLSVIKTLDRGKKFKEDTLHICRYNILVLTKICFLLKVKVFVEPV